MHTRVVLVPVLAAGLCFAAPAVRADDRSYLTAFLEDNLSGAGRKVVITDFAGALSSRATMRQLTIADDQGIWITLDDVVLDWSRTALLSGEVIINELSASAITISRLPEGEPEELTPEAEEFSFSLPELPVSVNIGAVRADRISLGAPVLGQALEGRLEAALHLASGAGTADVTIERTDAGPEGLIALKGSYSNETGQLALDLAAREGAGGLVAEALDLPGAPAAALVLQGQGTFDDFAATFSLESDGEERLSGPITLRRDPEGVRAFTADLAGNPAPLFLPGYADFLGDQLKFTLAGEVAPSGALRLDALDLTARSLQLKGQLRLAADGLPELIGLEAEILDPEGAPVVLPVSGPEPLSVSRAGLSLDFDSAKGDGWRLDLRAENFAKGETGIARMALTGSGRIDRREGRRGAGGTLRFDVTGLSGLAPDLAQAVGQNLTGSTLFSWREGNGRLRFSDLDLQGEDYGLRGQIATEGLGDALNTRLDLRITAGNLARFAGLADLPLAGSAALEIKGDVTPLTGGFDLELAASGQNITTGIAEADRLLASGAALSLSALRDTEGTLLRAFTAKAATLNLSGSGRLQSDKISLTTDLAWGNLSDLGPSYGGALQLSGGFEGNFSEGLISLSGTGEGLRTGTAELDRLIAGRSDLTLALALVGGSPVLRSLNLASPHLTAEVTGEGDEGVMRVNGRLSDLALLAPEFPGAVTLSGRLEPQGQAVIADLRLQGPAAIDAAIQGRIAAQPDLRISGTSEAALVNGLSDPVTLGGRVSYDLTLAGGWGLSNAAGRISLAGGDVALPARGLSLERVTASADLSGGTARLSVSAEAPRGGRLRLEGPLGLAAPYSADLSAQIDGLSLRDPELFDTSISAALQLRGPLLGAAALSGRVTLAETELRVPSTGFASAAELDLIRHQGDSAEVRATRARAGVGADAAGPAGSGAGAASGLPPWQLNLQIEAPNRVFVRGRGLDAELGGAFVVSGTLNNIIPSGGLELVRGRLDILGQRLVLDRASLVMEGSFIPYLTFVAVNNTDDVTSIVTIEGPANDPQVTFSSDPELPQEEVLAWLLFGRGLETISAFQALQLANAVATLAGRGGEGIVGKLRRGTGFDDLDVSTAADGSTSVNAGKYIAENVYTELGVDQQGNSRINLNLDLREGVTVKGRVESDGSSGLGIFLERDY